MAAARMNLHILTSSSAIKAMTTIAHKEVASVDGKVHTYGKCPLSFFKAEVISSVRSLPMRANSRRSDLVSAVRGNQILAVKRCQMATRQCYDGR